MAITAVELNEIINKLIAQANDERTPEEQRKASLAEAMAYSIELEKLGTEGNLEINKERVNQNADRFYNSDGLSAVVKQGGLNEFIALPTNDKIKKIDSLSEDIGRFAAAEEAKPKRASTLFAQMNGTWRIASNSKEFDAAKKAMETLSKNKKPSQVDNYIAADTVKKYVSKNLNKAESATGMKRMAISLAFLKQTMSKQSFEAYCNNLNGMRGFPPKTDENGKLVFDVNNPRCIEPDTIGTIDEVYKTFRERFFEYEAGSLKNKDIDPRDIAMLTALKNLQAKNKKYGENLVVEHEALCEELKKVQKDKRFIDAIKTKDREELIEMAWSGSFDSLDKINTPLTEEQLRRVEENRALAKKELHEKQLENAKKAFKEETKPEAEKNRKDYNLKNPLSLDAIEKAEEAAKEAEKRKKVEKYLKANRSLSDLQRDILPDVMKLGDPVKSAFMEIEVDMTELAAKLIVLGDCQKKFESQKDKTNEYINLEKFQKRVDKLKKDPVVKELADELLKDPNLIEKNNLVDPNAIVESNKDYKAEQEARKNEKNGDIYPSIDMSKRMIKRYKDDTALISVDDIYNNFGKNIGNFIDGGCTLQRMTRVVAITVALDELKAKQKGKDVESVKAKDLQKRRHELEKDPDVQSAAQSFCGPTKQDEFDRKMASSKEQGKDFLEMVRDTYTETVEKKKQAEQKKNKAKEQPQKAIGKN